MNAMNKTCIIVTIDTETFASGSEWIPADTAIHGKIEGGEYGIGRIMDMCERHGFRATFFVDVLEHHIFGKEAVRAACREISGRGHDVQLHVHPNCVTGNAGRFMSDYDFRRQKEMIGEGRDLIGEWTGDTPVAFRAGSYGANLSTINALSEQGFRVDSSYYTFHKNCSLSRQLENRYKNRLFNIGSIVEIPVTVYKMFNPFLSGDYYSKVDVNACTKEEICHAINALAGRTDTVILFLHSFSFLQWDSKFRFARPDPDTMEKFGLVLQFISGRPDLEVKTMRGYCRDVLRSGERIVSDDHLPESNFALTFRRFARRYIYQQLG